MADQAIALMAHLMRRAGFGAPYAELEARAARGYEATVEELLHPEAQPELDYDIMLRYKTEWVNKNALEGQQEEWVFRMINTRRPLQEKIALFWHGLLCTGHAKCENPRQQSLEIDMFRRLGLGQFPDLLLALATDPAMVFYLDNCMSHKGAINENWGRELLELFSMGVGMDGHLNYTEDDVKEAARAFTGWTVANAMPRYPYGRYTSKFIYDPNDHDDSVKTFLGETGNWNGEDIINIIARQPAAARFVSRHLYNFFVADEPPVPAWQHTPPRDPEAIKLLEAEYFRSDYNIRSMLRLLFNADFFKNARFARVKSPVETVVGTTRLVGDFTFPRPGLNALTLNIRYMGQDLLNPPTVEGWHTGKEWIDSGTLVERINFTADNVGNVNLPGVQAIIARLRAEGPTLSPERLVDGCLELLGGYKLAAETHSELAALARSGGEIQTGTADFPQRAAQMLQSIVATTEYLFA
jgi:uncharacterized protein (DUF1800 family)